MVENYGDLLQAQEEIDGALQRRSRDDFLLFVRNLVLPSVETLFEDAMLSYEDRGIEPFQRRFFADVAPSLDAVCVNAVPPCRRFWLERTKKASKDNDIAVCLLWVMAFPKRPTFCQVVAADKDQAGIIKHRAEDILFHNEWLREHVRITRNSIVSQNGLGETVIEATDKASAHGETPAILVLNELVHVAKWEVMETHYNNAVGVPRGIMIVSTNAGYRGTKAEKWRNFAEREKDTWHVHLWKGRAPWLNEKDVSDAKEMNTRSEFDRLFGGRWVSGKGDALSEEAIDAIFRPELSPMKKAKDGWMFVGGLDLGVSHDHAGIVVLGIQVEEKRLRVARMMDFEPSLKNDKGKKEVDIARVKRGLKRVFELFDPIWFGCDPAAGGSFLIQEMRVEGMILREMAFTGASLNSMAVAFMKAVKSGRLECYEDETLRRDIGKFEFKPVLPEGYRIVALSDEYGHADVGTALLICLPKAVELVGGLVAEAFDVFAHDDSEISDEEMREAREADPFLDDIFSGVEEDEEEFRYRKIEERGVDADLSKWF